MVIYSNQSPAGFGSLGLELSSERGIVKTLNTEREYKSMCPSKKKKKKKINCKPCFVLNSLFIWSGWGERGHTCEDSKLSVHKSGVYGEVSTSVYLDMTK